MSIISAKYDKLKHHVATVNCYLCCTLSGIKKTRKGGNEYYIVHWEVGMVFNIPTPRTCKNLNLTLALLSFSAIAKNSTRLWWPWYDARESLCWFTTHSLQTKQKKLDVTIFRMCTKQHYCGGVSKQTPLRIITTFENLKIELVPYMEEVCSIFRTQAACPLNSQFCDVGMPSSHIFRLYCIVMATSWNNTCQNAQLTMFQLTVDVIPVSLEDGGHYLEINHKTGFKKMLIP